MAAGRWPLEQPEKEKKPTGPVTPPPKPIPVSRPTLIPKSCNLVVNHKRLNRIYDELRRLNVSRYPNATAALFRVFLELTLKEFELMTGGRYLAKGTLNQNLMNAASLMENKGLRTKDELNRSALLGLTQTS